MGDETYGSEAELAACVVAYLKELQFEIYQEVEGFSGVADIVAVQKPIVMVVETKTSLNFDVIAQAIRWRQYAHRAYVAVPKTKTWSAGRQLAYRVCRDKGIGVLECTKKGWGSSGHVTELDPGKLNRHADSKGLKDLLREEHKNFALAGSASGGYWTPFKQTCGDLLNAVKEAPGTTLKDLLAKIETHYSSPSAARSSLAHWIERGKVPGLRIERTDGKILVYPCDFDEPEGARRVRVARAKAVKDAAGE